MPLAQLGILDVVHRGARGDADCRGGAGEPPKRLSPEEAAAAAWALTRERQRAAAAEAGAGRSEGFEDEDAAARAATLPTCAGGVLLHCSRWSATAVAIAMIADERQATRHSAHSHVPPRYVATRAEATPAGGWASKRAETPVPVCPLLSPPPPCRAHIACRLTPSARTLLVCTAKRVDEIEALLAAAKLPVMRFEGSAARRRQV